MADWYYGKKPLINYLTIALTHGLLAFAVWRLLQRADLDTDEVGARKKKPWHRDKPAAEEAATDG